MITISLLILLNEPKLLKLFNCNCKSFFFQKKNRSTKSHNSLFPHTRKHTHESIGNETKKLMFLFIRQYVVENLTLCDIIH